MPAINISFINRFKGDVFINIPAWGALEIDQAPYAEFSLRISKKQACQLIRDIKQINNYICIWGFYRYSQDQNQIFLTMATFGELDILDLELMDEEIERKHSM